MTGEIAAPPRTRYAATLLTGLAAASFIALPLAGRLATGADLTSLSLYGGANEGFAIVAAAAVLVALAILTRHADVRALALLVFAFVAAVSLSFVIARVIPPTPFTVLYLVAPFLFVVLAMLLPGFGGVPGWLKFGRFTIGVRIAVGLMIAASVAGLAIYFETARPDFTHQPVLALRRFHGATLFAIGLGIAGINAAVEECAYRGILMNALDAALGPGLAPVLIQALAFGTFHFNSTEPGLAGIAVTVALGLVLGGLRRASRGMAAPYLVHLSVDIGVWTLGMLQAG